MDLSLYPRAVIKKSLYNLLYVDNTDIKGVDFANNLKKERKVTCYYILLLQFYKKNIKVELFENKY